ncbi:MAG: hypothetical protein ACKOBW_08315, partial [Planctomycetota bacterium]
MIVQLFLLVSSFWWATLSGQHFIRTVQAAEPLFAIDGMAALSQGGCNQGACHGNLHGKGG